MKTSRKYKSCAHTGCDRDALLYAIRLNPNSDPQDWSVFYCALHLNNYFDETYTPEGQQQTFYVSFVGTMLA